MDQIVGGLKKFQLSFKMQDDIYNQIMGEETNGSLRGKSIDEQAAERRRAQEAQRARGQDAGGFENAGEVLARIRGVPDVQPET